jgi:hypothetical protein
MNPDGQNEGQGNAGEPEPEAPRPDEGGRAGRSATGGKDLTAEAQASAAAPTAEDAPPGKPCSSI